MLGYADDSLTVELESFQEQSPLVAKRIIEAAAAQVQRRNQVFNRGRRVAFAPEKLQSLDEYFFTVERFRASDSAPFTSEFVHIVLIVPEFVKSFGSGSPLSWNRKCKDRVGLYTEDVLAPPAII